MSSKTTLTVGRIMARMALYVILGIPLVAIIWETLNHLLALQADSGTLLAIPAIVLLVVLLYFLNRTMLRRRPHADARTDEASTPHTAR